MKANKCQDCILFNKSTMRCTIWFNTKEPCDNFEPRHQNDTIDKITSEMLCWSAIRNGTGVSDNCVASENEFDMTKFACRILACINKDKKVE